MEQLSPNEQFPITYVLGDPNDTGTYYVRAVIYDDVAGTTIETVDLTDLGSGRFKKLWYVCSDVSGQGRYISIVCKVYTDSGYTTLADSYQQKENKYLVQERWNRGNMGSAPIVSYKEIRKIIQEELGKTPKTEFPKPKEFDLSPIADALIDLRNEVRKIEIPKPKEVDLSSVREGLDKVKKAVELIRIPEPEKLDLSPVLNELKRAKITEAQQTLDDMLQKIRMFFLDDVEKLTDSLNSLKKQINEIQMVILKPPKDEEEVTV